MLFWLIVTLLMVGIILLILGVVEDTPVCGIPGAVLIIIFGISLLASIAFMIDNYVEGNTKIDSYNEQYKSLVYKLESDSYKDEFGLLNKDVVDSVTHWNTDLAHKKSLQRDFWVGIFYPNIYDQFELIELHNE